MCSIKIAARNEESNCKYYIFHSNPIHGAGNTIFLGILHFLSNGWVLRKIYNATNGYSM